VAIKIYTYYSSLFLSEVKVSFTDGIFSSFEVIEAGQKKESAKGAFNLYILQEAFIKAAIENKVKLTEINREVSFDMFWDAYAEKNCGKKKAIQSWEKLPKEEQLKAFDYIKKYNSILNTTKTAKAYATTYLNQARWDI